MRCPREGRGRERSFCFHDCSEQSLQPKIVCAWELGSQHIPPRAGAGCKTLGLLWASLQGAGHPRHLRDQAPDREMVPASVTAPPAPLPRVRPEPTRSTIPLLPGDHLGKPPPQEPPTAPNSPAAALRDLELGGLGTRRKSCTNYSYQNSQGCSPKTVNLAVDGGKKCKKLHDWRGGE